MLSDQHRKMLSDRQQKILNNRTVKGFVNNILEKYPSATSIICLAHDALYRKYNGSGSGFNISLLSVSVLTDKLNKISTEELWQMFDSKPVLKLGNNNGSRNIKPDKYVRVNISTKLNKVKDITYYPTSAICYESEVEVDKLKKLNDEVNQIILDKDLHSKYSWVEANDSGSICIDVDLDDLI